MRWLLILLVSFSPAWAHHETEPDWQWSTTTQVEICLRDKDGTRPEYIVMIEIYRFDGARIVLPLSAKRDEFACLIYPRDARQAELPAGGEGFYSFVIWDGDEIVRADNFELYLQRIAD